MTVAPAAGDVAGTSGSGSSLSAEYPEDPILKKNNPWIEKMLFNNIENGAVQSFEIQYRDQS